jgi:iron-sulfur cluster assembly accessory protein
MFGLTTDEVKVTDAARAHLKRVIAGNVGLRLMILKGKGCGGNEYDLKGVTEATVDPTDDRLQVEDGLTIFIPKTDVLMLFGTTIDYVEDNIGNKRIEIINPNEKARCGCGLSVSF